ncbi:hypothetical protein BB561_004025 [Smittium simulii]|uniref:phosphomevalonate kinase n=1 Tax=Smittium simulii TaxID=133385 RepID=A0A2T9YIH7_9FUNG|nr:hypothetical protein BB561_004025 [Smittium simulii]
MPSIESEIVVVSTPGKALLFGGYLVLDRNCQGMVIAVDSRVYVAIKAVQSKTFTPNSFSICVKSFQFTDGLWEYTVTKENTTQNLSTINVKSKVKTPENINPFIQTVLETSFLLIQNQSPDALSNFFDSSNTLEIVIGSDNAFYSSALRASSLPDFSGTSLPATSKFNSTGSKISAANKTGLGSSAALVSSLCASLLIFFGVVSATSFDLDFNADARNNAFEKTALDKDLVHSLAQYAHNFAQGKIGSGFDVSSAIYGSQIYRRCTPSLFEPAMDAASAFFCL